MQNVNNSELKDTGIASLSFRDGRTDQWTDRQSDPYACLFFEKTTQK